MSSLDLLCLLLESCSIYFFRTASVTAALVSRYEEEDGPDRFFRKPQRKARHSVSRTRKDDEELL